MNSAFFLVHRRMRAPIIVNPRRMIAIQALPHESAYRHDHPLRLEASGAGLHP